MAVAGTTRESGCESSVAKREITFVVRCAGERTAFDAVKVLKGQLGCGADEQVHAIEERPFAEAVRRTLELGIESGRAFTVGMDADVLLLADGVERLSRLCGSMTPETYSLAGLTLCRFFGGLCFRGVHVYRSEHLKPALGLIGVHTPGGAHPDLKPETAVVEAMQARGFGFGALPIPLGIHDYEQYYRHIYLKMRLRARRQLEVDVGDKDAAPFREACRVRGERGERDFEVALWGLDDGAADSRRRVDAGAAPVPRNYDWNREWPEFDARMRAAGLEEKTAVTETGMAGNAERVLADHDVARDGRTPEWIRRAVAVRRAA